MVTLAALPAANASFVGEAGSRRTPGVGEVVARNSLRRTNTICRCSGRDLVQGGTIPSSARHKESSLAPCRARASVFQPIANLSCFPQRAAVSVEPHSSSSGPSRHPRTVQIEKRNRIYQRGGRGGITCAFPISPLNLPVCACSLASVVTFFENTVGRAGKKFAGGPRRILTSCSHFHERQFVLLG